MQLLSEGAHIASDPRKSRGFIMHDEIKRGRFGDYMLTERPPTVAEYCSLRVGAGLTPKDPMAAEAGLARTLYAVCLEYRGEAIGMGRVVGDGGVFFDVVDIAVMPDHQKKGFGKAIMDALMAYIRRTARPTAWISLMAGPGVEEFYKRYGFITRGPDRPGMSFMVEHDRPAAE
jgi:GNAT superfamily N-acetyltransferase